MDIDHLLQHWINRETVSPFLDQLMAGITNFSAWRPIFFLGFLIAFIVGNFRLRTMLICLVLAVGFTDGILVNSIKHVVGRPRPLQIEPGVRTVSLIHASPELLALRLPPKVNFPKALPLKTTVTGRSFPSAHSANIMAATAVVFLFYRKRRIFLLLMLALTVCYSRIYVGAHWPSDVLAGIALGVLSGTVITFSINAAWKRWGARLTPAGAAAHPSLL